MSKDTSFPNFSKDTTEFRSTGTTNGIQELSSTSNISKPLIKTPQFSLTYSNTVDYQNFVTSSTEVPSTRPTHIKLKVELPGVKSASLINIDTTREAISLEVEGLYSLKIDLKIPVLDQKGEAKFDKKNSILNISIPVEQVTILQMV